MIRLTIREQGLKPKQFKLILEKKVKNIETSLSTIGDKVLDKIRRTIRLRKKRGKGTGNLEKAFTKETIDTGTQFIVGIGNVNILNSQASYWYVVNYGLYFGSNRPFIPGGGRYRPVLFEDGPATARLKGRGRSRAILVKERVYDTEPIPTPIRPMNYLEATYNWLFVYWSKYWGKILP